MFLISIAWLPIVTVLQSANTSVNIFLCFHLFRIKIMKAWNIAARSSKVDQMTIALRVADVIGFWNSSSPYFPTSKNAYVVFMLDQGWPVCRQLDEKVRSFGCSPRGDDNDLPRRSSPTE
ncbi:hypothetical protein X777_00255 [Ooceraea biroi]|uniref:Uncharacterized protein n=1 Tax=Ooceraea biroi TaxID=2015173 RepID=A0A026VU12_OOCBI|nr:hypothetical protein X777_00255 [Ooceraea biroi]